MNSISTEGPRILIARLSSIGDCIHTFPLAHAIKDRWPGAFVGWIVEKPSDQLLVCHPSVDHLMVLPKRWYKSPKTVSRMRRELTCLKFDVSVDPQGLTKSSLLPWLARIPRRIGFTRPTARETAPWLNTERVSVQSTHVVDRYLEVLSPLGIVRPVVRFDVTEPESAESWAEKYIKTAHLSGGYLVINPGAGWDSRLWPPKRFGRVARYLGEKRQIPCVVAWAGDRERNWAEEIVAQSSGHALLAPRTSLLELAALLRRARMFLGSDTGPLHLATAVGAPCVALHGTTRAQVSGPYGEDHLTIQKHYHGGPGRKRRGADNAAMRAIDVEEVVQACEFVLERGRSARKAA